MPNNNLNIAITPVPVVIGQPWSAVVTGLRPGQDQIQFGYRAPGVEDPFLNVAYYAADASGKIEVSLSPLPPNHINDGDVIEFRVSEAHGIGTPTDWKPASSLKLLGTQNFTVAMT